MAPAKRSGQRSEETFTLSLFARNALQVPFDGGSFFALALLRRLLVILTAAQLGEDTRLFTGTLEASQCSVEVLILFYANTRHTFRIFCPNTK